MAAKDDSTCSMQFEDHVFTETFRQQMVQLRKAKQHTDVILKADRVELHCHQVALSAGSGYFNAMFTSDSTESKSGVVEINDMSSATLESIVDYIYTGQIQITIENAQQLIQASDLYHLDTLKKPCETFMVDHLEAQNSLGFNRFAKTYRLNDLTKESRGYMLSHFKDCVLGPEFKELTEEELVEYIKDDHLDVKDEDPIFEAVIVWVGHDVAGRCNKLLSILQHVRVYYCSQLYISHIVQKDTIAKYPDLIKYIHKASTIQTTSESADQMPRQSYPAKRCLVLVDGAGEADKVLADEHCSYFDEGSQTWKRLAAMPSPRNRFFSVCRFNKNMLVSGGTENANFCYLFDIIAQKWKKLPSLTIARFFHSSIEHMGKTYIIGGRSLEKGVTAVTSSVEIFDVIGNKWLPTQPLITAVESPMVASSGPHIYCFGGATSTGNGEHSRQTQAYDTIWGRWSERAEMPQICEYGAAVTVAEKIFVLGGYSKSCMSYSPDTDQWSRLLSQPSAKHGYAPATLWRGRILVSGGYDGELTPTSLIEEYNPVTDTWKTWGSSLEKEQACHYLLDFDLKK